ncbi:MULTISPECIES: hypothetical protein [unclassified Caballeronia]|uniref:hypothetical protein n=1 Tax=unclassified Caballeronia TaxID=2646786 RepID=UPI0020294941|nr:MULTISPECIES: hypothetical protein [unclassified Caballeronia]
MADPNEELMALDIRIRECEQRIAAQQKRIGALKALERATEDFERLQTNLQVRLQSLENFRQLVLREIKQ